MLTTYYSANTEKQEECTRSATQIKCTYDLVFVLLLERDVSKALNPTLAFRGLTVGYKLQINRQACTHHSFRIFVDIVDGWDKTLSLVIYKIIIDAK